MLKEIKYTGFTTVPSDYDCPDGELAASINIIPEDGGLKPLTTPVDVLTLNANQRIVYIHKTNLYTHYIIYDSSDDCLKFTIDGKTFITLYSFSGVSLYQVNAVGNTLIQLTSVGLYYWLWKDGSYLELGSHIPELAISFGLQGEFKSSDTFYVDLPTPIAYATAASQIDYDDTNRDAVTSAVLAKVNSFIQNEAYGKGKFIFPFFVRYAYRLYDGNLYMHSAPVFMTCATDLVPNAVFRNFDSHDGAATGFNDARVVAEVMQLDYSVIEGAALTTLKKWSDIVSSVDVFISKPIYTYDESGYVKSHKLATTLGWCICKDSKGTLYKKNKLEDFYNRDFSSYLNSGSSSGDNGICKFVLPKKDNETIKNDIEGVSNFYLLHSFTLNELSTSRTLIPISNDYMQSLTSREVMTDDYLFHDAIIPSTSYAFNGRLNLSGIYRKPFVGFRPDTMMDFVNGNDAGNATVTLQSVTTLKEGSTQCNLASDQCTALQQRTAPVFLFYPNTNATQMTFGGQTYALKKSSFLNGAYCYNGFSDTLITFTGTSLVSNTIPSIEVLNKVYTSEINNPFFFPLSGINTVGTGIIKGICSAAKALSQGQFGQFPLYAFTTEGVWALELQSDGLYKARQPITRDVCISADSITQIDNAVLFATNRGIMLISGSQTTCLSDAIAGKSTFQLSLLPKITDIAAIANMTADNITFVSFLEYVKSCRMIYDYTHQRIIVYDPGYSYAYVYSLKSKAWGMMLSSIVSNVNSYPDAYAIIKYTAIDVATQLTTIYNNLVNYSADSDNVKKGFIVTRPIKLGYLDIQKTVDTIIQRGYFRKGHVQCVLYASRDLVNWFAIWTSSDNYLRGFTGTPYKYFRIALVTSLSKDENITSCTVQFTPRLNNRPR